MIDKDGLFSSGVWVGVIGTLVVVVSILVLSGSFSSEKMFSEELAQVICDANAEDNESLVYDSLTISDSVVGELVSVNCVREEQVKELEYDGIKVNVQ